MESEGWQSWTIECLQIWKGTHCKSILYGRRSNRLSLFGLFVMRCSTQQIYPSLLIFMGSPFPRCWFAWFVAPHRWVWCNFFLHLNHSWSASPEGAAFSRQRPVEWRLGQGQPPGRFETGKGGRIMKLSANHGVVGILVWTATIFRKNIILVHTDKEIAPATSRLPPNKGRIL